MTGAFACRHTLMAEVFFRPLSNHYVKDRILRKNSVSSFLNTILSCLYSNNIFLQFHYQVCLRCMIEYFMLVIHKLKKITQVISINVMFKGVKQQDNNCFCYRGQHD